MRNPFIQPEPTALDKAIESAFKDLDGFNADMPEYAKIVDQQIKLHSLKPQRKQLDPNTLIIAGVNLYVGWRALKFEETAVITTQVHKFLEKLGIAR